MISNKTFLLIFAFLSVVFVISMFVFDVNSPQKALASTINAATCGRDDVNTAVTAAVDGDVVMIPAGTCSWTAGISISGKGIHITSAIKGSTIIRYNAGNSTLLTITEDNTHNVRVSNLRFEPQSGGSEAWSGMYINILSVADAEPVLINENFFGTDTGRVMRINSNKGVIWNNEFDGYGGDRGAIAIIGEEDSWTTADTMGMNDSDGKSNVYIENNVFTRMIYQVLDPDANSRVVIRNNLFDQSAISSHGADTSVEGTRHWELYDNEFTFVNHGDCSGLITIGLPYLFYIRGGTGVIADNVIPNVTSCAWGDKAEFILTIQSLRRNAGPYPCATTYPVPRQIGQNHDGEDYFTDPVYFWGNTGGGNYDTPSLQDFSPNECGGGAGLVEDFVIEGRDYIVDTEKPGYEKYTYPHPLTAMDSGNPSDQTADLLLDFEDSLDAIALTTTVLDDSTRHGTTWGTWSISDASSKLTTDNSGEQQALTSFTVNGTNYDDSGGARGMAYSLDGGAGGFATFTPSTTKTAMSVGLWYKTVAPAAYDGGPQFLQLWNEGFGNAARLLDRRNGGDSNREIALISGTSATINVTDNTWYWVTVNFIRNSSSCEFELYDTSGVQVGTTQTFTCADTTVDSIRIGNISAITSQAQTAYFDDLVLDWTNQVFPLGIASADSEDPVVTSFTIPATSSSLTVPISTFTATDNVGVTGYLVNESAVSPGLGDAGWSGTPQDDYVFSSSGAKTLYAWAKDDAGNISSSASDTIAIDPQNHYIRAGAGGTGDGTDWTNAMTNIPSTFVRGDTYYIADGTYAGTHTLDDVESSTTYVYIKKAIGSAHGTSTGWDSTYGDGVATFTGSLILATGYWDIDGVVGGGPASWTTGHGMVFTSTAGTNVSYMALSSGVSNVRVRHVYFNQTGNTEIFTVGATAIYNAGTLNNSIFEYLYFDNIGGLPFLLREGTGNIMQYNYSGNICGVSAADVDEHCEGIVIYGMDDIHFRWNFISESPSSGGFVKNDSSTSTLVRIYGNFFQNGGSILCNTGTCTNWRVFNNSINDGYGPVSGDGTKIGAMFYNNLIYNSSGVSPWTAHDYNWWSDTTLQCSMDVNTNENITDNFPGDCDALSETRDPYLDSSGDMPEDFRLSSALTGWPGTDVCILDDCVGDDLFTLDAYGNTRGFDGVWDIGAYELDTSTTYTIGGTISGLTGTVVLRNNGGDNLSRSANGSFTFATPLSNSASYAVTVFTQPSGQTCTVSNGSGTVSSANITNVAVACVTNDVTPPVRSAGSPSGALASGTTGVAMTLTTNETATCKYGTTASTAYGSIASTFSTTAGTSHSQNLTGLTDGSSYNYYIRCIDSSTNANTDDYTISFSVATASGGGGGSSRPTPTPSPAPSNSTSLAFTNIKLVIEGETYYVIKDNKRYGVTNPGILFSYGLEFKDGVPATAADNAIPYTENLKPGDGALVKKPGDSTVYLIFDNSKHGFTSELVFNALGYSFSNVLEVTANELDALPIGTVVADPNIARPNGTFIDQDGTIFRVSENKKFGIPSMEVYNSFNLDNSFAHVVLANAQDRLLSLGSVLNFRSTK